MSEDLPPRLRAPHPDRLPADHPTYDRIVAAHDHALREGQPGYIDPVSGLFVLTAATLWDRGRCCTQGCRHCPYIER